jgi:bacillithiol system protein YtxJ
MFFNSSKQSNLPENWIPLRSEDQLKEAFQISKNKPVIFFKHSTRCSISSFALKRLQSELSLDMINVSFYYLDLIAFRPLSNKIEQETGIRHESPQLIIYFNQEVLHSSTHDRIQAENIIVSLESAI